MKIIISMKLLLISENRHSCLELVKYHARPRYWQRDYHRHRLFDPFEIVFGITAFRLTNQRLIVGPSVTPDRICWGR